MLALAVIGSGAGIGYEFFGTRSHNKSDAGPAEVGKGDPNFSFDNSELLNDVERLLKDNPGLFIGEAHIDDSSRFMMYRPGAGGASVIDQLAASDCKSLVLEMFRESDQKLLDVYFDSKGTAGEEAIRRKLAAEWNFTEGSVQEYLAIIRKAVECGIKPYGAYPDITPDMYAHDTDPEVLARITDQIDDNIIKVARGIGDRGKYAVYAGSMHISDMAEMAFSVRKGETARKNRGVTGPLEIPSIELREPMKGLDHTVPTDLPGGATVEEYIPEFPDATAVRGSVVAKSPEGMKVEKILKSPYLNIMDAAGRACEKMDGLSPARQETLAGARKKLNEAIAILYPKVNPKHLSLATPDAYDDGGVRTVAKYYKEAIGQIDAAPLPANDRKELTGIIREGLKIAEAFLTPPARGR
ncbi:MAG: hypothetical protein JO089_04845 [Alphaproteobacteria bacterium]|nr:hypothetical protein [Alphaproteobacteria bacterium]